MDSYYFLKKNFIYRLISHKIRIFAPYGGMVDAPVYQTGVLCDVRVRVPLPRHGEASASLHCYGHCHYFLHFLWRLSITIYLTLTNIKIIPILMPHIKHLHDISILLPNCRSKNNPAQMERVFIINCLLRFLKVSFYIGC